MMSCCTDESCRAAPNQSDLTKPFPLHCKTLIQRLHTSLSSSGLTAITMITSMNLWSPKKTVFVEKYLQINADVVFSVWMRKRAFCAPNSSARANTMRYCFSDNFRILYKQLEGVCSCEDAHLTNTLYFMYLIYWHEGTSASHLTQSFWLHGERLESDILSLVLTSHWKSFFIHVSKHIKLEPLIAIIHTLIRERASRSPWATARHTEHPNTAGGQTTQSYGTQFQILIYK